MKRQIDMMGVTTHRARQSRSAPVVSSCLVLASVLLFAGCGSQQFGGPFQSDQYGVSAVWDDETQTLKVKGKTDNGDEGVEIHDAADGKLLGTAAVTADGTWSATASTPACTVHVALPSGTVVKNVEGAPADCAQHDESGGVTDRALVDSSLDANNPERLSTIPNGLIISPRNDVTVNVGDYVEFAARSRGGNTVGAVSYSWNFGGAAANTTVQNPGPIVFSQPGVYAIQLSVVDALGVPDPTPAVRVVTVNGPNFSVANIPVPTIFSPAVVGLTPLSINVGESLYFSGGVNNLLGTSPYNYEWDFAGAAPNAFVATPGNIQFTRAGTFRCSFNVIDPTGIRSAQPAVVIINVGAGGVGVGTSPFFNQTPVGMITSPRRNITVNVGDTVNFEGNGRDPDYNNPLSYSWDFSGVTTPIFNSPTGSVGPVRFTTPGVFTISMRVTDALGAVDPNPPTRTITVLPVGGLPIGGTPIGGTVPPGNTPLGLSIISPPSNVFIQPGQSVFFAGQSPVGNSGAYRYFWNFGGGAPISTLLSPGDITFSVPGQYVVEFTIADALGNVIGVPETRIITVTGTVGGLPGLPGGIPGPVSGLPFGSTTILSPVDNSTINVGVPVTFNATPPGLPPVGYSQFQYEWEISQRGQTTAVFNSRLLNPPPFTFQSPGRYRVAFRVRAIDVTGNIVLIASATNRITVGTVVGPASTFVPIAYPAQDMILNAGSSINFQAGTIAGNNLNYQWDFGGIAPQSFLPTPPPVYFRNSGTYTITLRVTGIDINGAPLNLYGTRLITVTISTTPSPFPTPFPNPFPTPFPQPIPQPIPPVTGLSAPEGYIDNPAGNITVRVGQPVMFSGRGFDPLGGSLLRYQWSFGGAAPNIIAQTPGTVTFNRVGEFVVSLLVVNMYGAYDPTPPTVVVKVTP